MAICLGCRKDIDPAFDAVATDERGRPWHTPCWVEHRGAQDTGRNFNDPAELAAISPAWWLFDLFKRRRRQR